MEQAFTAHLKAIGAYLPPAFKPSRSKTSILKLKSSVIIPVRNREKTIAEAIRSVFFHNRPISSIIFSLSTIIPPTTRPLLLKNGPKALANNPYHSPSLHRPWHRGMLTHAIMSEHCGRFAIQLDSDDLYINRHVFQRIVDTFHKHQCAMIIGSYKMVNFKLEEIPPGIIDHKEWTTDNGHNNALRINGLGAPRAFYTPLLRQIRVPNVKGGEDYATALAISREYQIERIYEPLYLCRRWEGNSDADLNIQRVNANNYYKDKIRMIEILARQQRIENGELKIGNEEKILNQKLISYHVFRRIYEITTSLALGTEQLRTLAECHLSYD